MYLKEEKRLYSLFIKNTLKTLNAKSYKNFHFVLKKNFNLEMQKTLKRVGFQEIIYDDLFTKFVNKRVKDIIIVINLEEPTIEIDKMVIALYGGKVLDWDVHSFIINNLFEGKNNFLKHLKNKLNFIYYLNNSIRENKKYYFNIFPYHLFSYYTILENIVGKSVLDVGTGNGLLPIIIKKKW